jgi:hypothetical protein
MFTDDFDALRLLHVKLQYRKGTVARDFSTSGIFHESNPIRTLESNPKLFQNSVSNSRKYSNSKVAPRGLIPHRNLFRGVSEPAGIYLEGPDPAGIS